MFRKREKNRHGNKIKKNEQKKRDLLKESGTYEAYKRFLGMMSKLDGFVKEEECVRVLSSDVGEEDLNKKYKEFKSNMVLYKNRNNTGFSRIEDGSVYSIKWEDFSVSNGVHYLHLKCRCFVIADEEGREKAIKQSNEASGVYYERLKIIESEMDEIEAEEVMDEMIKDENHFMREK